VSVRNLESLGIRKNCDFLHRNVIYKGTEGGRYEAGRLGIVPPPPATSQYYAGGRRVSPWPRNTPPSSSWGTQQPQTDPWGKPIPRAAQPRGSVAAVIHPTEASGSGRAKSPGVGGRVIVERVSSTAAASMQYAHVPKEGPPEMATAVGEMQAESGVREEDGDVMSISSDSRHGDESRAVEASEVPVPDTPQTHMRSEEPERISSEGEGKGDWDRIVLPEGMEWVMMADNKWTIARIIPVAGPIPVKPPPPRTWEPQPTIIEQLQRAAVKGKGTDGKGCGGGPPEAPLPAVPPKVVPAAGIPKGPSISSPISLPVPATIASPPRESSMSRDREPTENGGLGQPGTSVASRGINVGRGRRSPERSETEDHSPDGDETTWPADDRGRAKWNGRTVVPVALRIRPPIPPPAVLTAPPSSAVALERPAYSPESTIQHRLLIEEQMAKGAATPGGIQEMTVQVRVRTTSLAMKVMKELRVNRAMSLGKRSKRRTRWVSWLVDS